jgi:hypothetical protein
MKINVNILLSCIVEIFPNFIEVLKYFQYPGEGGEGGVSGHFLEISLARTQTRVV